MGHGHPSGPCEPVGGVEGIATWFPTQNPRDMRQSRMHIHQRADEPIAQASSPGWKNRARRTANRFGLRVMGEFRSARAASHQRARLKQA
jgi:hypothetical protein